MRHRIVSLVPAGTEIVAALGGGALLVGVSHECDYPGSVRSLPRVTASAVRAGDSSADIDLAVRTLAASGRPVVAVDDALLAALAPTVVITQGLCDVCAVGDGQLLALADLVHPAPVIASLGGRTIAGVQNDIRLVADVIGQRAEGEALVASMDARFRLVHERLNGAGASRPRVAVIEWLDPLYAAGHWTPELVRRGGGMDVLAEPGSHSMPMDMAHLRDAEPGLLLFAPCGFDVARAECDATRLLASPDWDWARGVEAWALDENALTSRAGPRLADAVEVVAAIIAPQLVTAPPAHYARRIAR